MPLSYSQKERPTKQGKYLSVRWNVHFAKCFRCGYEWIPKKQTIKTCAKCRSPYWDVPRNKLEYMKMREFAIGLVQTDKYRGYRNKPDLEKCVDCGEQAKHWEHRSYARPLLVEPVCQKCNIKRGPAKGKPSGP